MSSPRTIWTMESRKPGVYPDRRGDALNAWELKWEWIVRDGPQWRCVHCSWLYSGPDTEEVPTCPECVSFENVTKRNPRRPVNWSRMGAQEERWLGETARRCGWLPAAERARAAGVNPEWSPQGGGMTKCEGQNPKGGGDE